ncbi:MAG TPA: hypothetical protein VGO50_12475 [Pyrinomonadaceae bacterium]|nr:hypothetical protein [Pyrinomonadaceae bacterium]
MENGMQGGFINGREAVREYWAKQFEFISPHLEPVKFETDDGGRDIVSNHQIVRDLEGNVLLDKTVRHIFTIKNGLVEVFEIEDARPFAENPNLQHISEPFDSRMAEDK